MKLDILRDGHQITVDMLQVITELLPFLFFAISISLKV